MTRAEVFAILKGTEWGDLICTKLHDKKLGKIDNMESILLNTMNIWCNRNIALPYEVLIKYTTFVCNVYSECELVGISAEVAKRLMTKMNSFCNNLSKNQCQSYIQ